MSFPSFFGSFMNRSPFSGRDCVEIESDPTADSFDREVCETFREFESFFQHHNTPILQPPVEHEVPDSTYKGDESDAQSLRDSILRPPTDDLSSYDNNRSDQDLDQQLAKDPTLLDKYIPGEEPSKQKKSHSRKVTIRTSVLPDGTTETTQTVVDSDGNEETTITRSKGHQTSCGSDDFVQRLTPVPRPFEKLFDWFSFRKQ
ncbi:HCLS1-associated protein X-1-like [Dysidea avara]|uniref:HCLS1-associated protein X-1-like n=1 Tax=Dysidea avara TaxID=196820 RepID=UPI003329F5A9